MSNNIFSKEIIDEIMIGILLFNPSTKKCIFANQMAMHLLEIDHVENLSLYMLFPKVSSELDFKPFNEDFLELSGIFQDVAVRKQEDDFLIANIGVRHMKSGTLIMLQDNSYQKKLQREILTKQEEIQSIIEELQVQNKQLILADKAKDRFYALISHELRTPASSIVATASYIQDGFSTDLQEILSYIDVINKEGQHLIEIINDILDFSKIHAGKLELFIESLSLSDLLKDRIHNIKKFAEAKSIKLEAQYCEANSNAYFDSIRLRQVIDNVLNNSVKYNKEGGGVKIRLDKKENFYLIAVVDEGKGIPDDQKDKVFNEFETIENVKNHHQGTGLGMPISKSLIEMMGGKIYFKSVQNSGTTFYIEVPFNKILPDHLYRSRVLSGEAA